MVLIQNPTAQPDTAYTPLSTHTKMPFSQSQQDSPAVNTGSESARLEALPTELITLIANDLDTKSLKQLRLSCHRLDTASSQAFESRLACVPFWFMQTSMQRLARLSQSRWSKHVLQHHRVLPELSTRPLPNLATLQLLRVDMPSGVYRRGAGPRTACLGFSAVLHTQPALPVRC